MESRLGCAGLDPAARRAPRCESNIRSGRQMQPYRNLSGRSGIAAYEIGEDFVRVVFRGDPEPYVYSAPQIPPSKIAQMKALALAGRGLASFISRNADVRDAYTRP